MSRSTNKFTAVCYRPRKNSYWNTFHTTVNIKNQESTIQYPLSRILHPVSRILHLVSCILFLVSCTTHRHSDKKIFRYNESSGLASLDPAFAKNKQVMWAVHQLYNTLIEIDSNMQMKPSLAKRWTISDDNLAFTFYLRDDVYFTGDACFANGKGRRLTAYDVEYSFKRIVDKNTASPGAWIFNNRVDPVNGFTAIDETTFRLKLARPFNPSWAS